MLDNEELLFDELYEKTKNCGRTQFIKLLMRKERQQKEFIKYLEDEIQSCEVASDLLFNSNKEMKVYKEILQKYKEIIGVSDENN